MTFRNFFGSSNFNAVSSEGTLVLRSSTITNNSSANGNLTIRGGSLRIEDSTIDNNTANNTGAGLWVQAGAVKIVNSTLSFNLCNTGGNTQGGGAIIADGGSVELINTTIASNNCQAGLGGGIYIAAGATCTVLNTVIANNKIASTSPDDCYGPATSRGHNLVGADNPGCGLVATATDLFGTASSPLSPVLGNLSLNGGTTRCQMPLSGSPLINAGDDAACPRYDQRGTYRPQGAHCDIGAVEAP